MGYCYYFPFYNLTNYYDVNVLSLTNLPLFEEVGGGLSTMSKIVPQIIPPLYYHKNTLETYFVICKVASYS